MHPTIFVIFGITGDLAARKLLPALLSLYSKKKLPARFAVIGFSRRSFSREEFRELIRGSLHVKPGEFKEEDVKHYGPCPTSRACSTTRQFTSGRLQDK